MLSNPVYYSIQLASKSVRETYSPREVIYWCERLWNDGEAARKNLQEDEEFMFKWSFVRLLGHYNLIGKEDNYSCVANYKTACNRLGELKTKLDKKCKEEFASASNLREKSASKFNVLPEIPKTPRQKTPENMELVMCDKRGCVEARKLVISTQTYYTSEFAKMEKKFAAELESKKDQKCQNCEKKEVKFSESTNERYRKTLEDKLQESEQLLSISAENEKLVKELESMRLINLQLQQEVESIKQPSGKKEIAALQALLESNKEQYSRDIYEMQERIKTLQKELSKTGAPDPDALRNGIEIINSTKLKAELENAKKLVAEKDEIIWNLKFEIEVKNKEENAMHSLVRRKNKSNEEFIAELQATIDHLATQIANCEATIEYLTQEATGLSVEELEKVRKENENLKKKLEKIEDKFDELEARLQCPICLSEYDDKQHYTVKIKCGHVFGKSCLQKAFSRSGVSPHCPICKKPSKIQQAIRIYI